MEPKLVAVTWNDAHQSGAEPFDVDEFHKPWVYTSVGWLVKNDAAGVTVAACKGDDEFDRALFVPRGMVVKVRRLK
jgi:hypothetical protein